MKKEFVLSDKIWSGIGWTERDRLLKTSDVKDFIRLLKDELIKTFCNWDIDSNVILEELKKIDKIAGDELISFSNAKVNQKEIDNGNR